MFFTLNMHEVNMSALCYKLLTWKAMDLKLDMIMVCNYCLSSAHHCEDHFHSRYVTMLHELVVFSCSEYLISVNLNSASNIFIFFCELTVESSPSIFFSWSRFIITEYTTITQFFFTTQSFSPCFFSPMEEKLVAYKR